MSFEKIYRQLALPLTKFVIKRVGGDSEAVDEVLSATLIAAWRGWNTFRHKSSYFTWLCRIALNKIADYYHDQVNRNSGLIVPLIDKINQIGNGKLSPEEEMALNDLRKSVNDCLDLLPPEKRKLLQFRYWYNYSYQKISDLTGLSVRAVEGQLYRAKHEFAKVWTRESSGV